MKTSLLSLLVLTVLSSSQAFAGTCTEPGEGSRKYGTSEQGVYTDPSCGIVQAYACGYGWSQGNHLVKKTGKVCSVEVKLYQDQAVVIFTPEIDCGCESFIAK